MSRTWNSAASTDLNDGANYTGSGALLSTDDLIFDNTSVVNAALTANLNVNSITTNTTYSGNISFAGYEAVFENQFYFAHTGTLNTGNKITAKGSTGVCKLRETLGTVTETHTKLRFEGTGGMSFDTHKVFHFREIVMAPSAEITIGGPSALGLNINEATYPPGSSPLVAEGGGRITVNTTLHIYKRYSGAFFTLTGSPVINGTAGIKLTSYYAVNSTITLPGFTYSGTGYLEMDNEPGFTGTVIQLTGSIDISAGSSFRPYLRYNGTKFDFNGYNLKCKELWGGCYGGGAVEFYYGEGNHEFTSYRNHLYNDVSTTEYYESASMSCSGSWTVGSNHTIDPGTSIVTLTGTGNIINGVFNSLIINAPGQTITLMSDIYCNEYEVIAGTVNLNGYHVILPPSPSKTSISLIYGD